MTQKVVDDDVIPDERPLQALSSNTSMAARQTRNSLCALLTGIACTVFGSRLIIISAFGSPVPVHDQWDAEAAALYSPYLNGTLSFAGLVAPHNGHRILLTRLLGLTHLELAGEWNTRLEMIVSALVLTASVAWLTALLMPLVAPHRRLVLSSFVALLFAFPIDFENTLWGFQSQVYLSMFFGIVAVGAFAAAPAFSARWFGGLVAAVLAYFSYATGVATVPAAAIVIGLQLAANARKRSGREYAALLVLGSLALAMTWWEAEGAQPMSTALTLNQGLGVYGVLTIAGVLPVVVFCRRTLAGRPNAGDRSWVLLGMLGWVLIQLAMFAYGRGSLVAPRYLDVVLLVYPLALVAVFALSDRAGAIAEDRRREMLPVTWVFAVVVAVALAGCASVLGCSFWRIAAERQAADVRRYLATGHVDELKQAGAPNHGVTLVFPDPQRQARVLNDPAVRAILAPEIRPAGADTAGARNRMLLRGALANATKGGVHALLALGPVFSALGVALLFAAGTVRSLGGRGGLRPTHLAKRSTIPASPNSRTC